MERVKRSVGADKFSSKTIKGISMNLKQGKVMFKTMHSFLFPNNLLVHLEIFDTLSYTLQ